MNISLRPALVFAVFLLSFLGAQAAVADQSKYFDVKEPIATGAKLTYFDLALQFAPGLAKVPMDGSDLGKLRHVGSNEYPTTIAKPEFGVVERIDIKFDGKPGLLLLFELGQADEAVEVVNVLALYDMSAEPKLLDAMDVGLDRESSFLQQAYVQLSPKFGMAFIRNSHHNAGEEYLLTSMIGIWDGKLHDVDTLSSYSWMTAEKIVETRPSFAAVKGALAIDATFAVKTIQCQDGCDPNGDDPSTSEKVKARYSWDAASGKFVRPEKAFDRVPQANMEE
jgi:hypothetical protein